MAGNQEIASMIGRYLYQCEDRGQTGGMRWDDIVTWYLEQREAELQTEEQYEAELNIANLVTPGLFLSLSLKPFVEAKAVRRR